MRCPECQHENPEDARFCNGCGHKLELACPECGKFNPPGSRFCNGCGHKFSLEPEPSPKDLSFDEKIDKIQRYLPKGLAEKIMKVNHEWPMIKIHVRLVTILFLIVFFFDMRRYLLPWVLSSIYRPEK